MCRYSIFRSSLLTLLVTFIFQPGTSQIRYIENASELGVDVLLNTWDLGCGMSFRDFDQDGWDDLTIGTMGGQHLSFYRNTHGSFEPVDLGIMHTGFVKQVIWVDFDNDHDLDLYLSVYQGSNRLYRNNGNLEFEEVSNAVGLPTEDDYSVGVTWGDYNRDGWIDLYVCVRSLFDDHSSTFNRMFKNEQGIFTEVTAETGVADPGKLPFCASFIDYNNDLWPDIFIANDKLTRNTLFRNNGDGTFSDVGMSTETDHRMNAMCVNSGDVNRDGYLDIYVTNTPIGNRFFLNQSGSGVEVFSEIAESSGTGFYGNGWASTFFDGDNDGDLDLYVSGSYVGSESPSSIFYEHNGQMQFEIVNSQEFDKDTVSSFSHIVGDIDNDGLLDIAVQNNPPYPYHFWSNQSESNYSWLKLNLKGVISNADGIGSYIEVFSDSMYQTAYTVCGASYLGQHSSYLHFGLGQNSEIDSLRVTWPTGHTDIFYNLNINTTNQITEGASSSGIIHIDEGVTILNPDLTTSNKEIEKTLNVNAWPNPISTIVNFQSYTTIEQIDIFSSDGLFIRQSFEMKYKIASIDLSGLPAGIYFSVILAGNQKEIIRLIKI